MKGPILLLGTAIEAPPLANREESVMQKKNSKNTARPNARKSTAHRPVARKLPLSGVQKYESQFIVTTTTTIVPRKTG